MRLRILLLVLLAGCEGAHREGDSVGAAFTPSNADVFGEFEPDGLTVSPPDGTFDTDNDCTPTAALGACKVVARGSSLGEACVCRADAISIGTLRVTGARALVLLATRMLTVGTLLDVSGHGSVDGPGASNAYGSAASDVDGGAGGSYGTAGAAPRDDATAVAASYGDPTLVPLLAGMTGQPSGGTGGGAGGALQLSAGLQIAIDGAVRAGGGGGSAGDGIWSTAGGGGGGAGGGVLIEADTVVVDGIVEANGGGGGGGGGTDGPGANGVDAGGSGDVPACTGDVPACGGNGHGGAGCPLYGYVDGGEGGDGATAATAAGSGESAASDDQCSGGLAFVGAGGGGGGLGRIRVNTATGCECGGTLSPDPTFGTVDR